MVKTTSTTILFLFAFELGPFATTAFAEGPSSQPSASQPADRDLDEAKWFSRKGSTALSVGNFLSIAASGSLSGQLTNGISSVSTQLTLDADRFVADHFSLGGFVAISYEYHRVVIFTTRGLAGYQSNDNVGIGLGPRIGYDFILGRRFSFWPTIAAVVSIGRRSSALPDGLTTNSPQTSVNGTLTVGATIKAPVFFHITKHVAVGLGPFVGLGVAFIVWPSITQDNRPFFPILFGLSSTLSVAL